MSLISSAPILPLRARRSVSRVNPEMSTKARVPLTRMCRSSVPVGDHASNSFGTYGTSRETADTAVLVIVAAGRTPSVMVGV